MCCSFTFCFAHYVRAGATMTQDLSKSLSRSVSAVTSSVVWSVAIKQANSTLPCTATAAATLRSSPFRQAFLIACYNPEVPFLLPSSSSSLSSAPRGEFVGWCISSNSSKASELSAKPCGYKIVARVNGFPFLAFQTDRQAGRQASALAVVVAVAICTYVGTVHRSFRTTSIRPSRPYEKKEAL